MSWACFISLYHSTDGNVSSHVLIPSIVLFLNVCIARYAAFTRWLCGSTSCITMFSSSRYLLTDLEATLSMLLNTGLKILFVKYVMFSLKVAIMDSSFKYFTGVS